KARRRTGPGPAVRKQGAWVHGAILGRYRRQSTCFGRSAPPGDRAGADSAARREDRPVRTRADPEACPSSAAGRGPADSGRCDSEGLNGAPELQARTAEVCSSVARADDPVFAVWSDSE